MDKDKLGEAIKAISNCFTAGGHESPEILIISEVFFNYGTA